jgi:hypothetical protein
MTAQNSIINVSGSLISADKETLPYATIRLSSLTDSTKTYTGTTNETGNYLIRVPRGTYRVEMSFLGFAKYSANIQALEDVKLPVITLAPENKLIKEVVITARTVTYKPNGYTVDILANPIFKNYDLEDILKLTPGTNSNYNGITVYGKNISKVYVNEREIRFSGEELMNYLKGFNGRNVKKMEVVASSGVEDDASGGGKSVLKITTTKIDDGGMATAMLSANIGESKYFITPLINCQIRNGKWSAYFRAGSGLGKFNSFNITENIFYNTGSQIVTKNNSNLKNTGIIRTTLGLGYDWDANNIITFEGNFNRFQPVNSGAIATWNADQLTTSGSTYLKNENKKYIGSFNFLHIFDKTARLILKLDGVKNKGINYQENSYEYVSDGTMKYVNDANNNSTAYTASADFEKKLSAGTFSAGIKYSDLLNENVNSYMLYTDNLQKDNDLDKYNYSEKIYAAFSSYSFSIGNLSSSLGLRIEHSSVYPQSLITPEDNKESKYTDLFPEIGLTYIYNKDKGHNIGFQYNRSIDRPIMDDLNPKVKQINEYTYSSGNPLLKASYGHNFTLRNILFTRYVLNLSYNFGNDGTVSRSVVDETSGIIYNSMFNGLKSGYFSAYAECPLNIGKWANLKFNFKYDWSKQEYMTDKNQSGSYAFGFSGMYRLPYGISIMNSFNYASPGKTLYTKIFTYPLADLQIQKQFLKNRLTAGIVFIDILNSAGNSRTESFFAEYYQKQTQTSNGRSVVFRLNYNFKWGNKFAKINRNEAGNANESTRIGGDN